MALTVEDIAETIYLIVSLLLEDSARCGSVYIFAKNNMFPLRFLKQDDKSLGFSFQTMIVIFLKTHYFGLCFSK